MSGCGCGGAAAVPAQAQARGRKAILPDRIRSGADLDRALAALGGEVIRSGRTAGGGSTGRVYSYDDDTGGAMPGSTSVDAVYSADLDAIDLPALTYCDDYYPDGECDDETKSEDECTAPWTTTSFAPGDTTVRRESLFNYLDILPLEQLIKRAMTHFNIPAMSVAVLSPAETAFVPGPGGGQKWSAPRLVYAAGFTHHPAFKTHGFTDEDPARNTLRPMTTPYIRFRVASISKMLTAFGVMRLRNQFPDTFKFSDMASDYVRFSQDSDADTIKIKHLLSHSSGLPQNPDSDELVAQLLMRLPITTEELITFAAESPYSRKTTLGFNPGDATQYSSFGMLVLGQIIEAVSGQSYADWVAQQVLSPCGMTSTRIADPLASGSDEVSYYANRISCGCKCECQGLGKDLYPSRSLMSSSRNGSVLVLAGRPCVRAPYGGFNHQAHAASSGWTTTVRDLARLLRTFHACLQGEQDLFLSATLAEKMVTQQNPPSSSEAIGLGWQLGLDKGSLTGSFYHTGRRCGTTSAMWSKLPDTSGNGTSFNHSIIWIANTDLSRSCRANITSELISTVDSLTFPSGDLL